MHALVFPPLLSFREGREIGRSEIAAILAQDICSLATLLKSELK